MRTDSVKVRGYPIPYLFILWACLKLGDGLPPGLPGADFCSQAHGPGAEHRPGLADFAPGLAPL